jgi:RHS repeat-associated protein
MTPRTGFRFAWTSLSYRLRRWLRWACLDLLPVSRLVAVWRRERRRKQAEASRPRPPRLLPAFDPFEDRAFPGLNLPGALQAALLGGGFALMGDLLHRADNSVTAAAPEMPEASPAVAGLSVGEPPPLFTDTPLGLSDAGSSQSGPGDSSAPDLTTSLTSADPAAATGGLGGEPSLDDFSRGPRPAHGAGGGLDLRAPLPLSGLSGPTAAASPVASPAASGTAVSAAPTPQPLILPPPTAASAGTRAPAGRPPGAPPPDGGDPYNMFGAGGDSFTAVEGQPFYGGFISCSGGTTGLPTSAVIAWGDGTTGNGTIVPLDPVGSPYFPFQVWGRHVYQDEILTGPVTVTITVSGPPGTETVVDQMTVNDATLTAAPVTPRDAVEGAAYVAPVASFVDSNPLATPADFTATITWGDGSADSPGVVTRVGGRLFQVSYPTGHVYTDAGPYTLSVNVADDGGNTCNPLGTITVDDANVTASGTSLGTVNAGTALSNVTVAYLTDANTSASPADFTTAPGSVTVAWGDGGSDTSASVTGSGGSFTVKDGHTYTAPGSYTIGVTAVDDDGNTAVTTSTVTVVGPVNTTVGTDQVTPPGYTAANNVPGGRFLVPIGEAQVAVATGGLQLTQPLDFDLSPGTAVGLNPALVYDSDTVAVRPILTTYLYTPASGSVPGSITLQLTWNGTAQGAVNFSTSGHSAGDTYVLAAQVTNPVTQTGEYPYKLEITGNDGSPFDIVINGQLGVVNNGANGSGVVTDPFGAGWGLAGLDQLVSVSAGTGVSAGMLMVHGDGSSDFFKSSGSSYVTPPNLFGTLAAAGGGWTFTDPHQDKENFDSHGRLTSVVDPHGLAVTYSYDGGGRLTGVAAPDGGRTTLTYSGGFLSQVSEPGGRTVSVSASTTLNHLTDADGNLRTFTYDSGYRLTNDKWAPFNATFSYDATTGRLTQVNQGLGSTWAVHPRQLQGLATGPAVSPASDVARIADPNNYTTTYTLDAMQQRVRQQTADGALQSWGRNGAEEVIAYADADAHATLYGYDTSGDLTGQTNPDGGAWKYQYDGTFHNRTLSVDPRGARTTYTLDTSTGDVLAARDPAGTTTYAYYQTGGHSNGLVSAVTDADGHTTGYAYDAHRRLSTTTDPLNRVTSLTYDANGNPKTGTDPAGHTSTTTYDNRNDVVLQTDGAGDTTTMAYDAAGDVTSSTDPRHFATNYGYDQRDFRTAVTLAAGTPAQAVTTTAYDPAGNATAVTDPDGHTSTYAYNAVNERTSATDPLGRTTATAFDPAGNVTAVTDPRNDTTTFGYDPMNRRVVVQDALGEVTTTAYDRVGNKGAVIDPRGDTTLWSYDLAGRLTWASDALWRVTTTAYDPAGNVTAVTDPDGHTTASQYDAANELTKTIDAIGNATTYAYDRAGSRTSTTDADGHTATAAYDAANRPTAASDALGDTTGTRYDAAGNVTALTDADGHTTTFAFDPLGRQTAVTNALNQTTSTAYDLAGNATSSTDALARVTTYAYDAANQRTKITDPLGRNSTMAYDGAGNLTSTTDYKGKVTAFAYDTVNRQIATTNPDSETTTTAYDPAGNKTSVIDAKGNPTTFSYDPNNRLYSTEDADTNVTQTGYDPAGNKTLVIDPKGNQTATAYDAVNRPTLVTDAKGGLTTTIYDPAGNATAVTDPLTHTTTFLYDAANRRTTVLDPANGLTTSAYDPAGNRTQLTDPTGAVTAYYYDAVNRLTSTADPNGDRTTVAFDPAGRQTASSDALGRTTTVAFDAGDRKTAVTDPNNHTTTFLYDNNDNLTGVIDSDNNRTTYAYDPANLRTQAVDPLGDVTTFAYDQDQRLTQTTDALGRKILDGYDGDGNRVGETWLNADGSTADAFTYTYDGTGNELTAANNLGTITFVYDDEDNLIGEMTPWGVALTYTYDGTGNATLVGDSLGGTVQSSYDSLNRLTARSFSDSSGNQLSFAQSYTARGQLSGVTRYADAAATTQVGTSSYAYDPAGNVTAINHLASGSGGGSLASYSYAYDRANRLTGESDNAAATIAYAYDNANQLLGDGTRTYAYDAAGNRNNGGFTPGTGNRLQTDGTWTYTYDADGNQVTKSKSGETWQYSYNQAGKLIQAVDSTSSGTTTVTYKYDALGQLAERDAQVNGGATGITRYVIDADGNVVADLDGANSNALLARYVYGDGTNQIVARVQYSGTSGTAAWYLTDHLGTVRDLMDNSGSLIDHRVYDAFGNLLSETNPSAGDRFGFTAEPLDPLTGEQQNDQRWYSPATQQWTTPDPLGLGPDSDPYRYVLNAPTYATDPSGLFGWKDLPDWDTVKQFGAAAALGGATPLGPYGSLLYGLAPQGVQKAMGDAVDSVAEMGSSNSNKGFGVPDFYGAYKYRELGRLIPWADWYYNPRQTEKKYRDRGVTVDDDVRRLAWLNELPGGSSLIALQELDRGRSLRPDDYDAGLTPWGRTWRVANIAGDALMVLPALKGVGPAAKALGPLMEALGAAGEGGGPALALAGEGGDAVGALSPAAAQAGALIDAISEATSNSSVAGALGQLIAMMAANQPGENPGEGSALGPAESRLSEAGALRQAAVEVHNLAQTGASRIPVNQSTVAVVEATLPDGTRQVFASGSGGYLRPAQVERLVELGVPRENIFSGAEYYKGFSAEENHAERVILRNLPEGATVNRWGISWGGQQRPIPCDVCEPFVNQAGGIVEGR